VAAATRALVARIRNERIPTAFPIEFRFVMADDIWISPFHGRESVTLSVHQDPKMDQWRLFGAAEEICRSFGGRPHWGKQHRLKAADFAAIYPKWADFQAARRRADPEGKFLSPYLKELFETGIA